MTDIINLLEKLGSDASLESIIESVQNSDVLSTNEKELLASIANEKSLQPEIKCFIIAPAEDDDDNQESPKEDDDKKETENCLSLIANG
ncbi:hypothetical protein [Thalassotalea montiporae]